MKALIEEALFVRETFAFISAHRFILKFVISQDTKVYEPIPNFVIIKLCKTFYKLQHVAYFCSKKRNFEFLGIICEKVKIVINYFAKFVT
jgi:hypothetical protein